MLVAAPSPKSAVLLESPFFLARESGVVCKPLTQPTNERVRKATGRSEEVKRKKKQQDRETPPIRFLLQIVFC